MPQAVLVVLLSSLAGGLEAGWPNPGGIVIGSLLILLGWLTAAALTWWLGTGVMAEPETRSNVGELLRTIGFANAPGVLRVLGLGPALRLPVTPVVSVWLLLTTVVAVRQALDYRSSWRSVCVCSVAWFLQIVFLALAVAALTLGSGPAL